MNEFIKDDGMDIVVSMKSGLEGRNNPPRHGGRTLTHPVSMKSGLEGRNNCGHFRITNAPSAVSMKSGLEGRNNQIIAHVLVCGYVLSQ